MLIALKESKPYNLWNVAGLAKNPPIELPSTPTNKNKMNGCVYKVLKSSPFNLEFYPSYSHRKTSSSMKNQVKNSQSRVYEFIRSFDVNNQQQNKK